VPAALSADDGQPAAAPRRAAAERQRDALAIALGAVTGATDAMSVLGLGGVFTSVMTANMVFLGISAGQQEAPRLVPVLPLALLAGVAGGSAWLWPRAGSDG
jgi:uncharacterized membrane protein YoaK (UPF0700 family)